MESVVANTKSNLLVVDPQTRTAVDALVSEFSYRIDHGQADAVAELFMEDGVFDSPMMTLTGKSAIAVAMQKRAKATYNTRHIVSNLRLQRGTEGKIRGTVMLTLYRWSATDEDQTASPTALVEYLDVYERGPDGEWLFASRKAQPILPPAKQSQVK